MKRGKINEQRRKNKKKRREKRQKNKKKRKRKGQYNEKKKKRARKRKMEQKRKEKEKNPSAGGSPQEPPALEAYYRRFSWRTTGTGTLLPVVLHINRRC